MSETTDFYMSWLGCDAFGTSSRPIRAPIPDEFNPLDISGCALWMDATDNLAVNANAFGSVLSWANKGYKGGQFDLSGSADVQYGASLINSLNVVRFNSQAYMQGTFTFDFQARSVFIVLRPNFFPTGTVLPVFTSDTNNYQETFFAVNGSWLWFEGKHPSPVPENAFDIKKDYTGIPSAVEIILDTDVSGNWSGINGTYITPIYQTAASYDTGSATYYLGNFFGGNPTLANYDLCELIMYDKALSEEDRKQVELYLRKRWKIPEAPDLFNPQDISGLFIQFDANNQGSFSLDASNNILSWSNLGLASNVASSNTNLATWTFDTVANNKWTAKFGIDNDLVTTMTLPYLSRTQFAVFQLPVDLSGAIYPYQNIIQSYTNSAMQTGINYDSNSKTYQLAMCQQAQNCPVVGTIPSDNAGSYNLAVWVNDGANLSNNLLYWNGGSNINVGTDLGNLFLQTPETYYIANANSNGVPITINEVLEYNDTLPVSTIQSVANYLTTKWGLSNMNPFV